MTQNLYHSKEQLFVVILKIFSRISVSSLYLGRYDHGAHFGKIHEIRNYGPLDQSRSGQYYYKLLEDILIDLS